MTEDESSTTKRLAAHLAAGSLMDLLESGPGDLLPEAMMRSWTAEHDVEADALRAVLLRHSERDDPRGVRLRGARIVGRLDLDLLAATIPLMLEDCLLDEGISARGAHFPALKLERCRMKHETEPAIAASGLSIDTDLSLEGSVVYGGGSSKVIDLSGASIGGNLFCAGATLRGATGPCLSADDLQVRSNVYLIRGFSANGAAEEGTLRFHRAQIQGSIYINGCLGNYSGTALHCDSLQLGDKLWLGEECVITGEGSHGTIRLVGAHIGGELEFSGASLRNLTGPALIAGNLYVGTNAFLDNGFAADGAGEVGTIRLTGANIGGGLSCIGSRVTSRSELGHRWVLDGLKYSFVPRLSPPERNREAWLQLFRNATPAYAAQPYQQLAAVYKAEGYESDVRAILIAQRRDQLDRGAITRPEDRLWARLTGVLLGYGYQPWRALLYLVAVFAISVAVTLILGGNGALRQSGSLLTDSASASPCTLVQTIGRGLDLGTPLLQSSPAGKCETTTATPGEALTVVRWALQVIAWALAALFVAGFTGIVRKS